MHFYYQNVISAHHQACQSQYQIVANFFIYLFFLFKQTKKTKMVPLNQYQKPVFVHLKKQ